MAMPAMAVVRCAPREKRDATLPDGRKIQYTPCMRNGVLVADTSRAELKVDFDEKPVVWCLQVADDVRLRKYAKSGVADARPSAAFPSASSQLISLGMALRDAKELSLKLNGKDTNWGWPVVWEGSSVHFCEPYPGKKRLHVDYPRMPTLTERCTTELVRFSDSAKYLHMGEVPEFCKRGAAKTDLSTDEQWAYTQNQTKIQSPQPSNSQAPPIDAAPAPEEEVPPPPPPFAGATRRPKAKAKAAAVAPAPAQSSWFEQFMAKQAEQDDLR